MNAFLAALVLASGILSFSCSALTGGDLQTWRAISQNRYDRINAVSLVLDRLIAQPPPKSLTPQERAAWLEQTNWMLRTKSQLLSFGSNLKVLLDRPAPSGANDLDRALATGQLVNDYVQLGDQFNQLMATVNTEAQEDQRRVEAATGTAPASSTSSRATGTSVGTSGTSVSTSGGVPADTTQGMAKPADRDPSAGGLAYSSPLKTRHDEATRSLSSFT